jgi:hypothetical protein
MANSNTIQPLFKHAIIAKTHPIQFIQVKWFMNSAAVAIAAPVMASTAILSFLLLLAADTRAPVTAPPIMAFFCSTSKDKGNRVVLR